MPFSTLEEQIFLVLGPWLGQKPDLDHFKSIFHTDSSNKELLGYLTSHGLLGFYEDALKRNQIWNKISSSFQRQLEKGVCAQWTSNLQLARLQDFVVKILKEENVSFILLKGLPLSERLYQNAMLRPSGDVDILLHPKDWRKGIDIFKMKGFKPHLFNDSSFHITLCHQNFPGNLEAHQRLSDERFSISVMDIFNRSKIKKISDQELLVMDPTDELLYLTYHHACHYLLYHWVWLFDVFQFVQVHHHLIDWRELAIRSKKYHLKNCLFPSLKYCHFYFGHCWSNSVKKELDFLLEQNGEELSFQIASHFLANLSKPFHSKVSRFRWARRIYGFFLTEGSIRKLRAFSQKV